MADDAARERELSLAKLVRREGLAVKKGAGLARLPGRRELAPPSKSANAAHRSLVQWVKREGLNMASPLTVATYCAGLPSPGVKFRPLKASNLPTRRRLQAIRFRRSGTVEANEYYLTAMNGKLELHADMVMTKGAKGYAHNRGRVGSWSMESRKRFFDGLLAVDWKGIKEARLFVTLTYPNLFPHDGRVCKKQLDAWLKRVERKFGKVSFVWKREFQSRGAPHYHGVLVGDLWGWVAKAEASLGLVRAWMRDEFAKPDGGAGGLEPLAWELRRMWFEVVGSGDMLHAGHGVDAEWQRDPKRHAKYLAFYMTKGDQDKLPERWHDVQRDLWHDEPFQNPGRWWGFWRGERLPRSVQVWRISARQFCEGREAIDKYMHDGGFARTMTGEDGNPEAVPLPDLRVSLIEFDEERLAVIRAYILGDMGE